jgi:ribosome-binding protein aMBF1 (putative translation factor)
MSYCRKLYASRTSSLCRSRNLDRKQGAMANKTLVSPIGTSVAEVALERAARSEEYRAERERLAFWSEIAAQVILFRTRQGISQAELAERLGTSYSAISRLESGQHATNVETLRRVAEALGLQLRIELEPIADNRESKRLVTA